MRATSTMLGVFIDLCWSLILTGHLVRRDRLLCKGVCVCAGVFIDLLPRVVCFRCFCYSCFKCLRVVVCLFVVV